MVFRFRTVVIFLTACLLASSCGNTESESGSQSVQSLQGSLTASEITFDSMLSNLSGTVQMAIDELYDMIVDPKCDEQSVQVGETCVEKTRDKSKLNPENSSDHAVTLQTAITTCAEKEKRLCRVSELSAACYQGVIDETFLDQETGPREWTSNSMPRIDNSDCPWGGPCGGTSGALTIFGTQVHPSASGCHEVFHRLSHETNQGDGAAYLAEFRCCYTL